MDVRCPHCQQPVELVDSAGLEQIDCPTCGGEVRVAGDVAVAAAEAPTLALGQGRNLSEAETIGRSNNAAVIEKPGEGRVFGEYELLAEIARGGMGVVFKARQKRLNRTVAVKMILAGELADQDDVRRFLSEAEAAAGLDHPGIVPVFESGEIDGQHFFSMGFVEGQSLAALLAAGPLPARRAAELVAHVADAIDYAHERDVIHRDLKPGNILLDHEGHPRVTDFGLAKRITGDSNLTRTGQALGTPSYMPPEQASGKLDAIGRAADVYALGAVLYAALTGRPPFQAATPLDTLLQVLEQEPVAPRQLNADVPRDLETIALKCLQKEPHKRYTTARELADELRRFLRGEPIHARPIGRAERAWRWCRRNPVVAPLTATAAAAIVAGAGVSTYFAIEAHYRALDAEQSAQSALAAEAREKQRRQAETAAKNEARAAIDRYVDTVLEGELLKDERFQPLRKKLLADALGYYKKFIEAHEHDATERRALAEVLRRAGSISRDTGLWSDALTAYSQAAELYQKMSAAEPSAPTYRNELANLYNTIGVLHKYSGDKSAAQAHYVRSRNISEKLVAEHPSVQEYQSNLAYTCHNIAMLQGEGGEVEAARANFGRAIEIDEKLAAEQPQVANYRCDLARHYNSLGNLDREHGQRAAARLSIQRAIEIAEKLVVEHPGNPEYREDLANVCYNLGLLEFYGGDLPAARADYHRAIEIANNLAAQHPTVAAFRAALADRYYASLGQLENASGEREAARATLQRAIALAEKLVAADRTMPAYRHILAARYLDLASLQFTCGETEAARANYQRATEIEEKLVAENPANLDYRDTLVRLCHALGSLQKGRGDLAAARANYQRVIEIVEKLVLENPASTKYRRELARGYNSLGLLQTDCGEHEALASLQRSLELRQALAAEQAVDAMSQMELAGIQCNLANALRNERQLDTALEHYSLAAGALEGVLAKEPRQSTAQLFLRNTYWGRAQTLMLLNRFTEAVEAWRRAIELNVVPETAAAFYLEMAESLARAGDHEAAAKQAAALSAGHPSADTLYRLAVVFSLCAAGCDDRTLHDRYAGEALQLLTRAQAAGFFNDSSNTARFVNDFALLLVRDDFREFLATVH